MFCWCCPRHWSGIGWCVDSWWSFHYHSCPAGQWTDPGEWWGGSYRQPGPCCKCEGPCPPFYSPWTSASPGEKMKKQWRRGGQNRIYEQMQPTFSEYMEGAQMGLTTTMLGPEWVCTRLLPYRCLSECITLDSFKYCREARSSTRSNIGGLACSSKSKRLSFRPVSSVIDVV